MKRTTIITKIAQGESIGGKNLVIGEGMKSMKTEQAPYRQLNGSSVYYSGNNRLEFEEPEFQRNKVHKWGAYYYPYLMIGMPDVGGWNKVYVDTRIEGWYLLWLNKGG